MTVIGERILAQTAESPVGSQHWINVCVDLLEWLPAAINDYEAIRRLADALWIEMLPHDYDPHWSELGRFLPKEVTP